MQVSVWDTATQGVRAALPGALAGTFTTNVVAQKVHVAKAFWKSFLFLALGEEGAEFLITRISYPGILVYKSITNTKRIIGFGWLLFQNMPAPCIIEPRGWAAV